MQELDGFMTQFSWLKFLTTAVFLERHWPNSKHILGQSVRNEFPQLAILFSQPQTRNFVNNACLPRSVLCWRTHCATVHPSSMPAGNGYSGARRYSTFTTMQPTPLHITTLYSTQQLVTPLETAIKTSRWAIRFARCNDVIRPGSTISAWGS